MLTDFSVGMRSLDVMMSKVEMLNSNSELNDLHAYSSQINEFEKAYSDYTAIKNDFSKESSVSEQSLVESFKKLFMMYKSLSKIDRTSASLAMKKEDTTPSEETALH